MARGSLFGFLRRARISSCSRGWNVPRIHRLLNYDVVLNVELVMDVDDVDLNTLSSRGSFLCAWCLLTVRLLRARSRIHIGRNDSLNVEELLVVLTRLRCLPALAHSVRLLLDVLSRVRPAVTTATLAASPAVGLGRRLVLAL